MKKRIFITLLLVLLLVFAGCVPSQYTKGVDADEYPDKDLPIYEDAIIYEYEGDDEEVTIMYGTEDDVDDVAEFYQDYFDDEGIMPDDEEEDDDEYSAEGFYEDFEFEIKVEPAEGKNEEKVFSSIAEVNIKFLSDEEIEEKYGMDDGSVIITDDDIDMNENDDDAEFTVPTVQEREIYNAEGITINMKDFSEGYYYLDLNLLLENTTEKEIDVDIEYLVINGFSMQDAYMLGTVEANVKLNTTLSIDVEELNRCGIEEIVTMEMVFTLTDTETWDTIATSDVITVDTGSTYVQTYDNAGITLVDDQGVKIIYQDFVEDDEYYGPYVVLYIENNGDKAIDTDCDNVQVNGFMISGWLYGTIQPGTASVMILDFYTTELDENGIDEVEEIKLLFQASYVDEWTYFMESELMTLPLN